MSNEYPVMPDLCNRRARMHFSTALNLLFKLGVNPRQLEILAVGTTENYKGDIHKQRPKPGEAITSETTVQLIIGYPSGFDMLPFQFFYGIISIHASRTSGWEETSRRLMAPFDAAVIYHDALTRFHILRFNFALLDTDQITQFLNLFDFDLNPETETAEALLWTGLLPGFHQWSGNAEWCEKIISMLLGQPIKIIENACNRYAIPERIQFRLGQRDDRLGRETVLGSAFAECDSAYKIIVSDVATDMLHQFLPGGKKRRKLQWLLAMTMPGNLESIIEIECRWDTASHIGQDTFLSYSARLEG